MRQRPARVAIVDDDPDLAVGLDAALAIDPSVEVRRCTPGAIAEIVLGELLAWRADVVVVDLDLDRRWPGAALASSLRACGIEVVARSSEPHPAVAEGTVVLARDVSVDGLARAVGQQLTSAS